MQPQEHARLKIVRLLDPVICLSCRFAGISGVKMQDGSVKRMIHCKRLDCDNWVNTEVSNSTPESILDEE